jgi:hypothetical protein
MTTRTLLVDDALDLMRRNPTYWTAAKAVAYVARFNIEYLNYLNHLSKFGKDALVQSIHELATKEARA